MSMLAEKLRELRVERDVSLQVVADAVGVSKPHIWELEKGKVKSPSVDLVTRLASFYNVSLDYLAGTKEREPQHKPSTLFRDIDESSLSEKEREYIQNAIDMAMAFIEKSRKGI